jgi:ATP-dependent protease ClpP protease subunit
MSILSGSTITLYGIVGDDFTDKDVRDALDEVGTGSISVNLNSGGGIAVQGIAIYNALKSYPGQVTVYIDGIAASAASLIAMAGDPIIMRDGALMMVHDPSAMATGTAQDLRDNADALDVMSAQAANIYAKRTNLDPKTVAGLMKAETWMDADQAIALGFATMRDDAKPARAVAKFDYRLYRNSPTMLTTKGIAEMTTTDDTKEKPWAYRFLRSAEKSGLALAELHTIIDASASIEAAKDSLIDAMHKAQGSLPGAGGFQSRQHETFDNPEFLGKAISDAIYCRMKGKVPEGGPAKEWAGRTLLDMGVAVAHAHGARVSWTAGRHAVANAVMTGFHTTSDFPNLLQTSGTRFLLESYEASQSPLKQLARQRVVDDFRPINVIRLGESPALLQVDESAEITYGTRSENKESYAPVTFARLFALSRQAIINDDLSAFTDQTRTWGMAAAMCEANALAAPFLANSGNGANLSDGNPLYTTARNNKFTGAGSTLSVTSIDACRAALRSVKGLDGNTPLNLVPKYILVPPALEGQALQAVASQTYPPTPGDANPVANLHLSVLVEPRFLPNTTSFRLFADPAQLPCIEIAYLNGQVGPVVLQKDGWNVEGVEFKCRLDIGVGLVEWRPTSYSVGA